jgi:hypothetical protein
MSRVPFHFCGSLISYFAPWSVPVHATLSQPVNATSVDDCRARGTSVVDEHPARSSATTTTTGTTDQRDGFMAAESGTAPAAGHVGTADRDRVATWGRAAGVDAQAWRHGRRSTRRAAP